MVAAPAAADAVARAKRLPRLGVGLHLVLMERDGASQSDLVRAGLRFFLSPAARRILAADIRAQFEAFRATGLTLDHVNGHQHVHIHPTIARLVVDIGRDYGLRAVRVPFEPAATLRQAFPGERYRAPAWSPVLASLRRRLARAGLVTTGQVFGIAWSGAMVEDRLMALLPHLPDGDSEIYCHPATAGAALVPGYRHADELAALLSPLVRERIAALGIRPVTYAELTAAGAPARAAPAG